MVTSTMAFSKVVFIFLHIYLAQYGKVEGRHKNLSWKDELAIKKELKLLNKPALKTIKTKFGELYDCIDFYKQPAFDHPLLKDHSNHYQTQNPFSADKELKGVHRNEGCPNGTVPIRRTTKEDLIRAKLFKETNDIKYRAVARTKNIHGKMYNGGRGTISVYRPSVKASQYSSARISVGNNRDRIEVGWTVNPILYGDDEARTYIYSTNGSSDCYNTQCSGFVIVSTVYALGAALSPVSTRGGDIYELNYSIYREQASGRWWVAIGQNYDAVGYWRPEIFTDLKGLASYVEWGGEAKSSPGFRGPEMGSGYFPTGNIKYDAFCYQMSTLNEDYEIESANKIKIINDYLYYYRAVNSGLYPYPIGREMVFGGPGQEG